MSDNPEPTTIRTLLERIEFGPLGLASAFGVATAIAAASNPSMPWWGVVLAFFFWPAFSIAGQVWL